MLKKGISILLCLVLLCFGAAAAETKVGSVISFGHYEQDNDTKNGPEEILWWVIDVQGDSALLLSGYGLDLHDFGGTTWATSGLHRWLNSKFFKEAFNKEEQERIYQTIVRTPANEAYNKPASQDTTDYIFVLSKDEFNKYCVNWGKSKMAKTQATAYAQSKTKEQFLSYWWLRDPGSHRGSTIMTVSFGSLNQLGNYNDDKDVMIRPSLWIKLEPEGGN